MGYRSDFQLVFNCSDEYKLQDVLDWLKDYAVQKRGPGSDLMNEILSSADRDDGTSFTIFRGYGWKLYDWDTMMSDLNTQFQGDEEVDIAYAIVGEEYDDVTVVCGEYTSVYIARSIDEPWMDNVPKKNDFDPFAPAPGLSHPTNEEQCACGKMKDVGQKCWWCGN